MTIAKHSQTRGFDLVIRGSSFPQRHYLQWTVDDREGRSCSSVTAANGNTHTSTGQCHQVIDAVTTIHAGLA